MFGLFKPGSIELVQEKEQFIVFGLIKPASFELTSIDESVYHPCEQSNIDLESIGLRLVHISGTC